MTRTGEKGVALVFTLFLMAALSAMAVSLMFLAQTETSASRNYRTMSQARYAGEAGVHKVLNYLSSPAYAPTVASLGSFDLTTSPVTYGGQPVVLSSVVADSNYPDSAVKSAFSTAAQGSLAVGAGTVTFTASATLLSMRSVTVYGSTPSVVQTWRINAVGSVPSGSLPATVEVSGILERDSAAAETFAIFATGSGCGAITMVGNETTDSYDSTSMTMSGGHPLTDASGGAVGTNGNLSLSGSVTVNGSLSTPRTGVGNCTNGSVTALTATGQANVSGDRIQLPQAKAYPTPDAPSPLPSTTALTINASTSCALLTLTPPAACTPIVGTGNLTITANGATLSLGNVSLAGGATLTIAGGTTSAVKMNVNTFTMSGNSSIILGTNTSVTMNVAGQGVATSGTVLDFTGGSLTNASYDSSKFQILYAGTSQVKVGGTSDTAATIYAPNAYVEMHGTAGFYGSVLSNTFNDTGGASVHYDRSLATKYSTLGSYVLSSFSWQKY